MSWNQTEQGRAYRAEYRARNREKLNAQQREYRARNQEADKERKRAWRAQNPAKAQDLRARARKDPQKVSEWQRVHRAKRNHGLRPEDWAAAWVRQDGRCYLCGAALVEGKVHVDHDHSCCPAGRSCQICRRGFACGTCNQSIALAGDNPDRLRRMADALEEAKCGVAARMAEREIAAEQLPLPGVA